MPRIFDNIDQHLLPALTDTLKVSDRADYSVGYFNLRGWKKIDACIEQWSGGEGHCCRLLVGMQKPPQEQMQETQSLLKRDVIIDNQTAQRLRKKLAEDFRTQLTIGSPTNEDEAGLRRLVAQLKARKVIVKLFLEYPLHAKLYLHFRADPVNPIVGYLGSSNLTLAGLDRQGELNVDVLDHDATNKLADWFERRWDNPRCVDISDELITIIEESWAREELIPPYHIYVKMAYHLSQEARAGLSEFRIPKDFGNKLFEFQKAAVKIAAHHLNKRGGVLIGDVVGLGKTLMATAVARIFEDDYNWETLIICPKNLVTMWEDYKEQYRLHAKVLSVSRVTRELPNLRRYRLVMVDESHNLRNREGKSYRAIQEYIRENESKVILLSATPYNKTYLDLSSQLRLFVPEDRDLGVRPEQLLKTLGETEFVRRHQARVRSLAAFEKSEYPDDWRDLMRLYLVRRTRSFIQDNYAETDPTDGRKYLTYADGNRSYFPTRQPRTVKFKIDDANPADQYARLYAPDVVDIINELNLPRYGLGNYVVARPSQRPTAEEEKILADLGRAGKRLMGFCRTNLFKRLESSGQAFFQSVERHILRNFIYLHALEAGKPLPVGTQDIGLLDVRTTDGDADSFTASMFEDEQDGEAQPSEATSYGLPARYSEAEFKTRAAQIYGQYATQYKSRFKWPRPTLFTPELAEHLRRDALALIRVLEKCQEWLPRQDAKLEALYELLTRKHPQAKVLIFTQFADTVNYLESQLRARGVAAVAGATGASANPTALAWRFSPHSNDKPATEDELRVLIATDVLSEGQNLQDCSIVVNYDLPWAIIRLIQRAGRVDRIGQQADRIQCYTFLPAEGVERIIRLRARVRQRLQQNAEVIGTDEAFFEDDRNDGAIRDLFTEKSGILDGEGDSEVDLASYAYQIWQNALKADPTLQKIIPDMPPVVFSAKALPAGSTGPEGVLVYMRTAEDNDALAWVDRTGRSITESQLTILNMARCEPNTPALERLEAHHELVTKGIEGIIAEEKAVGGQLGRPSGARFRTYDRLKQYLVEIKDTLWDTQVLRKTVEEIYRYPLRQTATDILNRQLRSGISDQTLAELVVALRDEDRLCLVSDEEQSHEPQIICSLGLIQGSIH